MGVTISTHNGSAYRRDHNIRNERIVAKEAHIDPQGVHETWHDEKPREAYERIFGEAVEAYNERQTRADRKIESYYNEVVKDAKKHPVYEMIIGVYGFDENGVQLCSEETGKDIMKEFVAGWKERNPNLELIGAYYHADEAGEPHVHIDYVPVAHGYKNGLDTQNGLVKALGEMGFCKQGRATAQILWEARENALLDSICVSHGLEVDHPKEENRAHLDTGLYKAQKALEGAIDNTKELLDIQDGLRAETGLLERQRDKANAQTVKALERASRSVKLHKSKDGQGYTYDKALADEIRTIAKGVAKDAEAISKTDLDVQTRYDQADALYRQRNAELHRAEEEIAEKLDGADREGKRIIAKAQKALDEQEKLIRDEAVERATVMVDEYLHGRGDDYTKRMEKFLERYKLGDKNLLEVFQEQEAELERELHRSHGFSR